MSGTEIDWFILSFDAISSFSLSSRLSKKICQRVKIKRINISENIEKYFNFGDIFKL